MAFLGLEGPGHLGTQLKGLQVETIPTSQTFIRVRERACYVHVCMLEDPRTSHFYSARLWGAT